MDQPWNGQHDGRDPAAPQGIPATGIPPKPSHSGLGIASFIISVTMLAAIIGSFAAMIGMAADLVAGGKVPDERTVLESSPFIILFAFIILGALFLDAVGAILGIVSLFQKNRRKLFGILGTIFSLLPIVVLGLLFLLGLALGGMAP